MIITRKSFSQRVEDILIESDLNAIDAVLEACNEFNVDPDMTSDLINEQLREKLKKAFTDLHYLKRDTHTIV